MHAENVVELQRGRDFAKKSCGIISETFAGPINGLMGIVVKFVRIEAVSNDRVVVPQDDVFRSAGDFLKDLLGRGPYPTMSPRQTMESMLFCLISSKTACNA